MTDERTSCPNRRCEYSYDPENDEESKFVETEDGGRCHACGMAWRTDFVCEASRGTHKCNDPAQYFRDVTDVAEPSDEGVWQDGDRLWRPVCDVHGRLSDWYDREIRVVTPPEGVQ